MTEGSVRTIAGKYDTDNNSFITFDGEVIENVVTYRSTNTQIANKYIVANIQWSDPVKGWILFQYVIVDEEFLNKLWR